MQRWIIVVALLVRIFISLVTTTFFQPDEYFQSLEVAHHLVFGYGHLTWEWLTQKPIRSILYPALNVPIYWLLKQTNSDNSILLIYGPRVLHGALAACTDISLYKLTLRVAGPKYATVALFISLTSFFHGFALSRSLSNSLETSLTTIALSYFPWGIPSSSWRNDLRKSLVFAALTCAVRPTNAVIWVYMMGLLLWRLRFDRKRLASIIMDVLFIGSCAVFLLFVLDSLYYGKPTFTPLNFLAANLSSISLFYGSSPWHYYLFQGLPIICTFSLPFVLHGAWLARKHLANPELRDMLGLIAWTIGIYSLAGHKEWRFIHPLLPLLHILAATSLVHSYETDQIKRGCPKKKRNVMLPIRRSHLLLILLNVPLIFYVIRVHSRAQIEVMYYLRSLPEKEVQSIGFLMPCHSTPWQAYVHNPSLAENGKMWALGCEPPLRGENLQAYKDQTDIFYESPATYLRTRFPSNVDPSFPPSPYPCSMPGVHDTTLYPWNHTWPQYLVMFGALLDEPDVVPILVEKGYQEVWRAEYGVGGDDTRQGGVVVWKFSPSLST
ncbi:unnamed protein product [Somion occarium]|uniref:Mannosyltransferase n=1 Tax=Somion occarium TaxID=3059160 RepID=A0ABP1DBD7_9APHY